MHDPGLAIAMKVSIAAAAVDTAVLMFLLHRVWRGVIITIKIIHGGHGGRGPQYNSVASRLTCGHRSTTVVVAVGLIVVSRLPGPGGTYAPGLKTMIIGNDPLRIKLESNIQIICHYPFSCA